MPTLHEFADKVRQVTVLALRCQQEFFEQSKEVFSSFLALLLRIWSAFCDDQVVLASDWLALRYDLIGVHAVEDFVHIDGQVVAVLVGRHQIEHILHRLHKLL